MAVTYTQSAGRLLVALLAYLLLEALAYKAVGFCLRATGSAPFDYQNWAYLFYFPEKKIKFIYYVFFLVSTWAYFLALSIYFSLREQRDAPLD